MDPSIKAKRIASASHITLEERRKRIADTDEAIAKGARQGPGAIWPDPNIKMSHVQTPEEVHWTHDALGHTPAELAELRAAIALLPPTAKPRPAPARAQWDTPRY